MCYVLGSDISRSGGFSALQNVISLSQPMYSKLEAAHENVSLEVLYSPFACL